MAFQTTWYMSEIPSVLHVDGTSRIQTVTEEQNRNFCRLIKEFDKKTNVPLLLNTSFNLNGEPIVETFEDSLKTFFNSEIDFLYLPDIDKIVTGVRQCQESEREI